MNKWVGVDADEWLDRYEQLLGRPLLSVKRPLNFVDAARVARITRVDGYVHRKDGHTLFFLRDKSRLKRAT